MREVKAHWFLFAINNRITRNHHETKFKFNGETKIVNAVHHYDVLPERQLVSGPDRHTEE